MRCQGRTRSAYLASYFGNRAWIYARLLGCKLRCEFRIDALQHFDKFVEGLGALRMLAAKILFPIHPAAHKFSVVKVLLEQDQAHRQKDCRLAARPWRKPVIGFRGGIA